MNGKNARLFMGELWELLLSAQASENGIPESFTQQKKEEIKKRMVNNKYSIIDFINKKYAVFLLFISIYETASFMYV